MIARETSIIYDCIYHNETGYIVRDKQSFAKKIIEVLSLADGKIIKTGDKSLALLLEEKGYQGITGVN